ncbi:hypothetical protein EPO34_04450 [Patescibacteria group bacterium]|nr:MAG: hypothetical protein EPO34_04450 [Patescibacteria group bacterium]
MRYLLVREGILALVWGLAAFCFVFFGTATAPGHKMRTAVSLAAFITLYSVSLLASADDRLHQAVQALPSMAGAWVAVLVVRKKMPAKTSP